jgi:hypothetical protein
MSRRVVRKTSPAGYGLSWGSIDNGTHNEWLGANGSASQSEFLHLLADLMLVPAEESRSLSHRAAAGDLVLEIADIGLGPRLA